MTVVTIIATGVANTASVRAALERCGARVQISDDARVVDEAALLVLPGVGAFGAGMERLREAGLVQIVRDRVLAGRPTLCICLGLQLLCAASEESLGVVGLGVIDASVAAFAGNVRTPQFGWNSVEPEESCSLLRPGHAYFANSFRLEGRPKGWSAAWSTHGLPFVAGLERGGVLACQFHPELSGTYGVELIGRWIARSGEVAGC